MPKEKLIDGYAVLHSIRLDGFDNIVACKTEDDISRYRLYKGERHSILAEYTVMFESPEYLKAMREFVRVLDARLDSLELDRIYRGDNFFTDAPLDITQCVPGGMNEDMTGKLIAIKTEVLAPEFRALSYQLHVATAGFGCSPTAMEQAVYCTNVYSGEQRRFDRSDVLGVVSRDLRRLPGWAKENLAKLLDTPQYESVLAKIEESKKQSGNGKERGQAKRKHKSEPEK